MVEVRASRVVIEVLAAEGSVTDTTRLNVSVAADHDAAVETQVSRQNIEVLGDEGDYMDITRLNVGVAAAFDDAEEVLASRLAIEVLGKPLLQTSTTRLNVGIAAAFDDIVEVQASRVAIEVLARQGSAGPVVPLALADDASIFLHNWVAKAELSTSFKNSVSYSPSTGAESRRGLSVKPFRTMKLEWMLGVNGIELSDLERLEVFLRRMGEDRFQVPIYKDQQELSAAHGSGVDTISVPTDKARFFPGARVAIVQLDPDYGPLSVTYHIIQSKTNNTITFDAALGVDIASGSLVFPLMDCEVMLEVKADYITAHVPRIRMTVSEVPGDSQLPPLKSDIPPNAEVYDEKPIWFEEPDWSRAVTKGRSRHGTRSRSGRADFVSIEADRPRQTHRFQVSGGRDEMWDVLEFFETRRGRLRTFWHIDQDQYLEPVEIDASGLFVGVSEIGDIADFQEEFDYVGIVMDDGKVFVREAVTIQQILTVFRITMDLAIDLGLSAANVVRVARARATRFETDELTETWTHTGHMTSRISLIETLNEQDFPTT